MPRLLLVDDEEVNIYALRLILEARGYECLVATNGADALRGAAEESPDAILLDIQMPVMDGFEVCRRLKDDPRTAGIPILFLTAHYRDHHEVARGLDLGANDYVTKPFSSPELLARVGVMVRLRSNEQRMERISRTDALTGLHNRHYLKDRMEQELHRLARSQGSLSCILLDIDHFKKINDTHGHAAGDKVLRGIAAIMRRHVRRSDLAVRYGGEEFLLVLFDNDKQGALRVAERVRRDVEATEFSFNGTNIPVTISSGVASCPDDVMGDTEELIQRADEALYAAKASGRNAVHAAQAQGQ